MTPHPLSGLTPDEINVARDVVVASHPDTIVYFREIYLSEPPKAQLREFLGLEHSGRLSPTTQRPSRLALCQYNVIGREKSTEYHESIVDIRLRRHVKHQIVDKKFHAALVVYVVSKYTRKRLADTNIAMNSMFLSIVARLLLSSSKRWQTLISLKALM